MFHKSCPQAYEAKLLIGDVLTGSEVVYGRWKTPDYIRDRSVLKNESGERVCQYMWTGELDMVVDKNPEWCTVWDHETMVELPLGSRGSQASPK
jgi:hypothetical protein